MALPGNAADLNLKLVATWTFEQSIQVVATVPKIDCAGFYGATCSDDGQRITPEFAALLRASWISRAMNVNIQINYIGALDLHPDATLEIKDLSGT